MARSAPARRRRPSPRTAPKVAAVSEGPPAPKVETPSASQPAPVGALVVPTAHLDFDHASSTTMFETLGGIRALPVAEASRAIVLSQHRDGHGYSPAQIEALCQLGYHYLRCGSDRLAGAIFDGLAAVDPNNAWVRLAQGLSLDHRGDKSAARAAYRRAAELDPRDATPLINLAELELEAKNRGAAKKYLQRARKVANTAGAEALEQKAVALLRLASR